MSRRSLIQLIAPIILAFIGLAASLAVKTRVNVSPNSNILACCLSTYDRSAGWPAKFATSAEEDNGATGEVDVGPYTYHAGATAIDFLVYLLISESVVAWVLRLV